VAASGVVLSSGNKALYFPRSEAGDLDARSARACKWTTTDAIQTRKKQAPDKGIYDEL
jgi:hypothetical protein